MIRIAHLSDLHFGKRFHLETWEAVANSIVIFDPDLIIVSGDLVDHPSPLHLLAAKCALRDLSRRARERSAKQSPESPRAAELVIIPGNHDVYEFGNSTLLKRLGWYERIFDHDDTGAAEAKLETELGCEPGFNDKCLEQPALTTGRFPWLRELVFGEPQKEFTEELPSTSAQKATVRRPERSPVLLALLDSNPPGGKPDFATGVVDEGQLIGLAADLGAAAGAYLARIAIVHHHLLPIAFAPGPQGNTEPMMVLRNAGAVLSVLADYRFDLVLHGHWHQAQFARVDLGTNDSDSYPMAVVAAGSAALQTAVPNGNSFNLITIENNGRVTVKSVFYGAGRAPDPSGVIGRDFRLYSEPTSAVKRRAYIRALERHPIQCDLREYTCTITENVDLWATHSVTGLRLCGEPDPYRRRPLAIMIPAHGEFVQRTLKVDPRSYRRGVRIVPAPDFPNRRDQVRYYWIEFPGEGLRRDGNPIDYSFSHACANSMTMTWWEANERANLQEAKQRAALEETNEGTTLQGDEARQSGWDEEWVGLRIGFPSARAILRVTFPASLVGVQPYVRCLRDANFPADKVNEWGDVPANESPPIFDEDMQEEEQHLHYDALTRTWRLDVQRPMVGYSYQIRWSLPIEEVDPQIASDTRQYQEVLLDPDTVRDKNAAREFQVLLGILRKMLKPRAKEKWVAVVFAYDSSRVALRPCLTYRSWSKSLLPSNFEVPLGSGISGAAFQQRRMVPWGKSWARDSLVKPVPHPQGDAAENVELNGVVSVPFYHPNVQDDRRPPPWATIGVVSFGSASEGARIATLSKTTTEAEEQRRELRSAVQTHAVAILDALFGGP